MPDTIHSPHDSRTAGRLQQLYGCGDLDAVFGPAPTAPCPWARAGRPKHGDLILDDNTRGVVRDPVWLSHVDPRRLWASQTSVVRTHAAYYLTGRWERTGLTAADRHSATNRFPIVAPDRHGRLVIRTGHHRSLAALIEGRPLLCRLATAPPDGAVAITPTLFVGTGSRLPHTPVVDVDHALALIADGATVLCDDDVAAEVHTRILNKGGAQ